jgi:hypothetical protein
MAEFSRAPHGQLGSREPILRCEHDAAQLLPIRFVLPPRFAIRLMIATTITAIRVDGRRADDGRLRTPRY